mmetsp:Transcript_23320/g.57779  ORF Transcript_23320/g.57779 Transcript_23320/m.57779 type:complete len:363 (-) Transcript_23320:719-1807(-)
MTIICRVLSHFPAASSAAAGSGAFSRHASMRVRRSTAGRSMDSVRGLRLNGSVPSHSRCRLMVSRSTTWPDPGSTTGSFITVCRMGSMNSSGMSRAYSVSRCSSMAARAVLTRETKSRRRPRRARDTSPAVKCAAHSKSQRKSSWDRSQLDDASSVQMESDGRTCEGETPLPPPPPQESPPPLQSPPLPPPLPPTPPTDAAVARSSASSRLSTMPAMGARIGARATFSRGASWALSVWSNSTASGPTVVWPSTKSNDSVRRRRASESELRNAAGISRARNSRTRSSVTLSSNMTVHLRWCCRVSDAARRPATSIISFIATLNSVMVQLRVLNKRSRNAASTLGWERQVSTMRCWNKGLALSG